MRLQFLPGPLSGEVDLPISKSIANRCLIIASLANNSKKLLRQLDSDKHPEDVRILSTVLNSNQPEINIGMAGTAMRFLTAFYTVQEGRTVVLTGSERMKQRPIGELVDALKSLGAKIEFLGEKGYPPLKIQGKNLNGGEIRISASVSSQFVSALMMVGPIFKNGLRIHLEGKVLSRPYIELTAKCMRDSGVEVSLVGNTIDIKRAKYFVDTVDIESDWSAASYFYALASVRPNSKFLLKGLRLNSFQGDSVLANWFEQIGVTSIQKADGVQITSGSTFNPPEQMDFTENPDLAQTFAFLAAASGKSLKLTGLDNLRVKETDRIAALKTEIEKLGVQVLVSGNEMRVSGAIQVQEAKIKTYNDHRMAMGAAVLATSIPIVIENPDVVAKSFPRFWKSLPIP